MLSFLFGREGSPSPPYAFTGIFLSANGVRPLLFQSVTKVVNDTRIKSHSQAGRVLAPCSACQAILYRHEKRLALKADAEMRFDIRR